MPKNQHKPAMMKTCVLCPARVSQVTNPSLIPALCNAWGMARLVQCTLSPKKTQIVYRCVCVCVGESLVSSFTLLLAILYVCRPGKCRAHTRSIFVAFVREQESKSTQTVALRQFYGDTLSLSLSHKHTHTRLFKTMPKPITKNEVEKKCAKQPQQQQQQQNIEKLIRDNELK